MSPTARRVIEDIKANGPARVVELAERLAIRRETVWRVVKRHADLVEVRDDAVTLKRDDAVTHDHANGHAPVTHQEYVTKYENENDTSRNSKSDKQLVSSSSYHSSRDCVTVTVTVTVTGDHAKDHAAVTQTVHAALAALAPRLEVAPCPIPTPSPSASAVTPESVTATPLVSAPATSTGPAARSVAGSTDALDVTTREPVEAISKRSLLALWAPDSPDRKRVKQMTDKMLGRFPREDGKTGEDDVLRYPFDRVRRSAQSALARLLDGKALKKNEAALFWKGLNEAATFDYAEGSEASSKEFALDVIRRGWLEKARKVSWASWFFSVEGLDEIDVAAPEEPEPVKRERPHPDIARSSGPVRIGDVLSQRRLR